MEDQQTRQQIIEKAASDPQFRQQFVQNPVQALESAGLSNVLSPEAREAAQRAQTERELFQRVLDKAASDSNFRQQLASNPGQALQSDPQFSQELQKIQQSAPSGAEVSGYCLWMTVTITDGCWSYFCTNGCCSVWT